MDPASPDWKVVAPFTVFPSTVINALSVYSLRVSQSKAYGKWLTVNVWKTENGEW